MTRKENCVPQHIPVFEIVWRDSGFDHGWIKGDEEINPIPTIRTYGRISHANDIMIEVSSTVSDRGDRLNPLGIPVGAILEINELKGKE